MSHPPQRQFHITMAAMMQHKKPADLFARMLASTSSFPGKIRLADFLGQRISRWNGGKGTFTLPTGETLAIDLSDRIQRLMWGSTYEPHVHQCLRRLLRPGDTFVDVGAHIGFFTLIASALVGSSGKVYAFEADPDLFATLRDNASPYPWVIASPKAVWSNSGPVLFSKSLQSPETGWGKLVAVRKEGQVLQINATSLDVWYESVGSPSIRAMKLDAEGSEPFILEGGKQLIARSRPFLIMEFNDQLLREVKRPREMVVNGLRGQGYEIFAIETGKSRASLDLIGSAEVLCVPRSRMSESKSILDDFAVSI